MTNFFSSESLSDLNVLISAARQDRAITESQENAVQFARRFEQLLQFTTGSLRNFQSEFESSPSGALSDDLAESVAFHKVLTFGLRSFKDALISDRVSHSMAFKLDRAINIAVTAMLNDSNEQFESLSIHNSTSAMSNLKSVASLRVARKIINTFRD